MEDDRDNLEKWMAQWDAAQKEIEAERPPTPASDTKRCSFFNGAPNDQDYHDSETGNEDWYDIFHKSAANDYSEDLLTDAVNVAYNSEGYGKQKIEGKESKGGKKKYTNNPIHFGSAGTDQEGEEGHVRVTDNWSDGKELKELDDLKKKMEQMERRVHEADVLKKTSKTKLKTELDNLRERVKKLSDQITSSPQKDLT